MLSSQSTAFNWLNVPANAKLADLDHGIIIFSPIPPVKKGCGWGVPLSFTDMVALRGKVVAPWVPCSCLVAVVTSEEGEKELNVTLLRGHVDLFLGG